MKEYIAEYIVPVEKKGNDCMFDFMNAEPLIRCKDCAANADTVPPCPLIIKPGPEGYCSFAVRKENE